MITHGVAEQARHSFRERAWGTAFSQLVAADTQSPLDPQDLEQLAVAAYLTGRDTVGADAWERAHAGFLARGEVTAAVRCAFWLGMSLLQAGRHARGGGWLARAQRLLDEHDLNCVERGYLLVPAALQAIGEGHASAAYTLFQQVLDIAKRFGDPDLVAFGRLGQGQALISLGKTSQGLTLLDEAMTAVVAGEVSPLPTGIVYCAVVLACQEAFDLRRAQEWTEALTAWCASQPDLVPFRGQCLVHRSELLQLRGAWPDALEEAQRACERLSEPAGQPALGMALYQKGELCRMRGAFAEAEEAYREASRAGRDPQPGLALLQLARGQIASARAAVDHAVQEAREPATRSRTLAAHADIALAAGDTVTARADADELTKLAATIDAPLLRAVAAGTHGAVELADGDPAAALPSLRQALTVWRELDAPYEEARVRVRLGLACRNLGDDATAELEFAAARDVFHRLGAAPDLAEVEKLTGSAGLKTAAGLTGREVEVLGLVAAGRTNRAIANQLVISEHTVARHLQNIFAKLGVTSRTAAAAFAYEHDLA